jgi:hypothetical protein
MKVKTKSDLWLSTKHNKYFQNSSVGYSTFFRNVTRLFRRRDVIVGIYWISYFGSLGIGSPYSGHPSQGEI